MGFQSCSLEVELSISDRLLGYRIVQRRLGRRGHTRIGRLADVIVVSPCGIDLHIHAELLGESPHYRLRGGATTDVAHANEQHFLGH